MALIRLAVLVLLGILSGPALAECVAEDIDSVSLQLDVEPPAAPDVTLRPVLPTCLRGLSGPEQENCPREELTKYGEEVDEWVEDLNDYATATNRFANQAAEFANSAIQYARHARGFADSALEFRNCEAEAIYSASEE
ncbi:hypothetical protein [uncultured Boseongicola sp.]|jgi:hypothetical protein|uniref:hypothetical protein n=1 Tax=uncultured Boseongicola sp. TaxID=1648499 RepID=UPI0026147835|nr:hypothetical protein [uncultured Boseongicola sp.]